MSASFADRVVVVSGGGSGIGAAVCEQIVQAGGTAIVADVDHVRAAQVTGGLDSVAAEPAELDVTDEGSWEALFADVRNRYGRLDGVVNCAGVQSFGDDLDSWTPAEWSRVQKVNLDGTFLGCKHAVRTMRALDTPAGSIVNIASVIGIVADGTLSYSASKAGVRMLTKCVALHCGAAGLKVRCNSVHPGYVETPLTVAWVDHLGGSAADNTRALVGRHPLGRLGLPAEIAAVVLFLLSDDSAFVTGAEFVADGGYLAV
jgi:NAD(P)-dependent dehydrogenase (short-subunit alcohol dehydrogenase family)